MKNLYFFAQSAIESLLFASILLLAGCWQTRPPLPAAMQPQPLRHLAAAHVQEYPGVIRSLEYSGDGSMLVLALAHCTDPENALLNKTPGQGQDCVALHSAPAHQKIAALSWHALRRLHPQENDAPAIRILQAGFLDENTWYVALADDAQDSMLLSIRQIAPAREMFQYRLPGQRQIFTNRKHIASGHTLLDWRTSQRYAIQTKDRYTHYALTANSRIMTWMAEHGDHAVTWDPATKSYVYARDHDEDIMIHDPIRQESARLYADTRPGDALLDDKKTIRPFTAAISADGRHVLAVSRVGTCTLWSVEDTKKLGHCGADVHLPDAGYAFRPGGQSFVVFAHDKTMAPSQAREHAVPSAQLLQTIPLGLQERGSTMAMNAHWLLVGMSAWQLDSKNPQPICLGHSGWAGTAGMICHIHKNDRAFLQPNGDQLAVVRGAQLLLFDLGNSHEK